MKVLVTETRATELHKFGHALRELCARHNVALYADVSFIQIRDLSRVVPMPSGYEYDASIVGVTPQGLIERFDQDGKPTFGELTIGTLIDDDSDEFKPPTMEAILAAGYTGAAADHVYAEEQRAFEAGETPYGRAVRTYPEVGLSPSPVIDVTTHATQNAELAATSKTDIPEGATQPDADAPDPITQQTADVTKKAKGK